MEEFVVVSSQKCLWPKCRVSLRFHTKELPHFVSFSTINQSKNCLLVGRAWSLAGWKVHKLKSNYFISLGETDFSLGEWWSFGWTRWS